MKKRLSHISYTVLLLASIMIVSSCSKILDQEPHNSTFTDAYFTNEQDASTALAGAYAILRSILMQDNSWHMYGDIPAGEFNPDGNYDSGAGAVAGGDFITGNIDNSLRNWQKYYKLLQQINLIINKVPDIADVKFKDVTTKKHIIGEAYFLRAYTYFYISRIWGNVPLKLAPDLNADEAKNIARSPMDSVLNQCLTDLNVADQNLDFGYVDENERAVRANKGAVYALIAHIKAWKGDYVGVEAACNEVINKGGYQLLPAANYSQIFVGRSMEGIFEININDGQSEGIALVNNNGSYNSPANVLMEPFIDGKTFLPWPINKTYVNGLFAADSSEDIRYTKFFYQPQSEKGQTIKYSNISYADGSAKNDPRMANNLIIFRLADIILLKAEALSYLTRDGEAADLVTQIRSRAGILTPVTNTGEELANIIMDERMRELYYEGQSFYDLVRTKRINGTFFDTDISYNERFSSLQFTKNGWQWPVDNNMFREDFTLKQTPYWQGKY